MTSDRYFRTPRKLMRLLAEADRLHRQAEKTEDFEMACRLEEQAAQIEARVDDMAMEAGQ